MKYQMLRIPGPQVGTETIPTAINTDGVVAGYDDADPAHAILFTDPSSAIVAPPGSATGAAASAWALNSLSEPTVVGTLIPDASANVLAGQAFQVKNGVFHNLHDEQLVALGAKSSWGVGVNHHGDAVGGFYKGSTARVWIYSANKATDLATLSGNADLFDVVGINDSGQIAGQVYPPLLTGGYRYNLKNHKLDLIQGIYPRAINASGQIVGRAAFGSTSHFQLWDGANPVASVPGLGGTACDPKAINADRVVVGASNLPGKDAPILHGFVSYDGAPAVDLNSVVVNANGWVIDDATGVNDAGEIVGTAVGPGGQLIGVRLVPVPEPTQPPDLEDPAHGRYAAYATILFGIINCAGGWEIVNGRLIFVPPRPGELNARATAVDSMTAAQRELLTAFSINGLASLIVDPTARQAVERATRNVIAGVAGDLNRNRASVASPQVAITEHRRTRARLLHPTEALLAATQAKA